MKNCVCGSPAQRSMNMIKQKSTWTVIMRRAAKIPGNIHGNSDGCVLRMLWNLSSILDKICDFPSILPLNLVVNVLSYPSLSLNGCSTETNYQKQTQSKKRKNLPYFRPVKICTRPKTRVRGRKPIIMYSPRRISLCGLSKWTPPRKPNF